MPSRRQTLLRLTRALIACLVVFLAFDPPAPRVELAPSVTAARVVDAPARAPLARPVEASRIATSQPLATDDALVVHPDATPRDPLIAVRRLYVELCSLLC
jgi:hypothetical protein